MRLGQTPSQTVGPFFALGLTPEQYGYALRSLVGTETCGPETPGEHIRIAGCVYDGEGQAVPDALIEIWQADARGRFAGQGADAGFRGFARAGTGAGGKPGFGFRTIKPGSIGEPHAPHIGVIVFMRGLLVHVYTRLYFADESFANARDPVLGLVPDERRSTLIAPRQAAPEGPLYRFDIHMQGARETVFFDI